MLGIERGFVRRQSRTALVMANIGDIQMSTVAFDSFAALGTFFFLEYWGNKD